MNSTIPACADCGRTLIVTANGLTMCPSEDFPTKVTSAPILLLGEPVENPFSPSGGKSLFNLMHDRKFAEKKKEWYAK